MPSHAASRLVSGSFDEVVIRETAQELREGLSGPPTFGLVFATPDYAPHISDLLELVRIYGRVPTVAGSTGTGLVGTGHEQEEGAGFSLLFFSLPGVTATAIPFDQDMVEGSTGPDFWRGRTHLAAAQPKAWITLVNPFTLNTEHWLKQWNEAYPKVPVFGGYAGGAAGEPEAWVFCNDRSVPGGVALALEGNISVHGIVSQGCKPIGEPLTVTQAERNILLKLGSRPAYDVLSDVYRELSDAEREQANGHLFAGLAVSEYVDEHKRGDFLVRNILGADPNSGAVKINAVPRVGQTLQYQLRDSSVANDELRSLLGAEVVTNKLNPYAGLLCTCHGRGRALFGEANHDAGLVDEFFPGLPLTGLFAQVQIGPVGERSFAHGYTASLALFAPAT